MVFRRFTLSLAIRLCALVASLSALAFTAIATNFIAIPAILTLAAIIQFIDLVHYVRRTNAELTRFLSAIRHMDFSQSFQAPSIGSGFSELGDAMEEMMVRFRDHRAEHETQLRYFRALVEQLPVPHFTVFRDGRVQLLNNAARRLFSPSRITTVEDLANYGNEVAELATGLGAGEKRVVNLNREQQIERFMMAVTEFNVAGVHERLISLHNIQGEFEAIELDAWQKLVSVLTHEIMNSLTPISSLARTARDLVNSGDQSTDQTTVDIRDAMDTVARRSDGLMQFIQNYRAISSMPQLAPKRIEVSRLFERMEGLVAEELKQIHVSFSASIEPETLEINVDQAQVEQVLLNLLRNAMDAVDKTGRGEISLTSLLNRQGRSVIEVADNGPGIPDELHDKIFIPFFTTKASGSGVGLALARQVMRAHGGAIAFNNHATGGARFTLTF